MTADRERLLGQILEDLVCLNDEQLEGVAQGKASYSRATSSSRSWSLCSRLGRLDSAGVDASSWQYSPIPASKRLSAPFSRSSRSARLFTASTTTTFAVRGTGDVAMKAAL